MKTPDNAPRSMLFVSGEKPERFAKAMAAGADLVCIDLEDAVHPARKAQARLDVLGWLAALPKTLNTCAVALRLNPLRTPDGFQDMAALLASSAQVDWLLLPKVEHAADLQCVQSWAGNQFGALCALLETPLGIAQLPAIAAAGGKLRALMLGGADLAAELGAEFGWDGLLHARGQLVNAARTTGLQTWDVPHIDLQDPEALSIETRRVLALGFDCKTAIHPQQIARIHAAHTPTAAELAWAQLLVEAVPDGQSSGAFLYQGRMVDAPLLRKARRIVENAARA
ncbi:HpcH/HpaI aldolase/citrate lyase family protein [Rhodoferax sp.]|uniref:HpcH/HpaI aldolase/citrate lyase family protein n=1 Tax=Rhodoferax sp. TaxID=50421 RepID=UPI00374CD54B